VLQVGDGSEEVAELRWTGNDRRLLARTSVRDPLDRDLAIERRRVEEALRGGVLVPRRRGRSLFLDEMDLPLPDVLGLQLGR
jgi:hypothetical protein